MAKERDYSMKIDKDNFLEKPRIKSIILGALTIVIGGICSALGSWDFKEDKTFYLKLIALIISVIIYIFFLLYYGKREEDIKKTEEVIEDIKKAAEDIKKMADLYKAHNEAYEELISGIMQSCKENANEANEIIHTIIEKNEADLRIWNFNKACFAVCEHIKGLLYKIGDGEDFEVVYSRLDEKSGSEIYINAYANKDRNSPFIFKKRRKIQEDKYHDAELFRKKQADYEILEKEEIDEIFEYSNREKRRKNKNKYSLYIAIPVFCNDKKMIGLLQIVCIGKTTLANNNKNNVKEIVSKYFIPYSFLLLMLHKLEKALISNSKES